MNHRRKLLRLSPISLTSGRGGSRLRGILLSPGRWRECALLLIATLIPAGVARAQVTPFDITGTLQAATLGGAGTGPGVGAHQGGTLSVNGITVTVPSETIVILPANQLSWEELFAQASPAYLALNQTGLASSDTPTPLTSYGVHVVGNVVGGTYIAGLISISTSVSGAGVINFIDYVLGEMRVGGIPQDRNSGIRVQINDPNGRFGRDGSPDPRFTSDGDNPTIRSVTGYPMCLQRTDPAVADDPVCPLGNRANGVPPDARQQAPFMVGDFVTYAGIPVADSPTTSYVSAHTIIDNAAIFTAPGVDPSYVAIDVTRLDTSAVGTPAITQFEGFSTDPTRRIHLFGIDLNPVTGAKKDRDWGSADVDAGGHWLFNPAQGLGSLPAAGTLLPPTRSVRAAITAGFPPTDVLASRPVVANGIVSGQYQAPIFEYVFPAQVSGGPPFAFETFPFLACGGFTSAGGTLAGQLNPWPGAAPPPCATGAPTVISISPNTGSSAGGTVVTIAGTNLAGGFVTFGANAATNVSCLKLPGPDGRLGTADDVEACTATSPAGAAGTVDVKVTNILALTSAATPADQFTYVCTPVITCPADVSANAQTGVKTVIVTYPAPTVVDSCPNPAVSCAPASGSAFPVGTNTATCTATSRDGVSAICSFNVNVYRCPLSKEFWEEHTKSWPVTSLKLGSQTYTAAELKTLIKNMSSSDASLILARRLIATLLNFANGSNPAPAAAAVADAQSRLAAFAGKLPYKVTTSSTAGKAMLADATALKSYNRGMLTSGCPATREVDDD